MANLVKIAELLKNAPDQTLMQELNNPNGAAPSYMVLSELQRRKKLRGSLMNHEPQKSVAEDMEAEASQANQMGIGAMMPQAQQPQQAPVGMAQGGEVPRFNGQYDDSYIAPTTGYGEQWEMYTDPTSGESYPRRVGAGIGPAIGRMFTPGYQKTPEWYAQNAARQAPTAPVKPVVPTPAQPTPAQPTSRNPAAPGGIPTLAPQKAASDDYSVNPLLDELKGYRKDLAAAYKNQADVYKQQSEDIKNAKSSDVALALMQAGFGIMGGRDQNAAVNIGQGAMPAIQQYAGMDRARREQLQKLALGQGALGIEQLGSQMKGVTAEGELGLSADKMNILREQNAIDRMYKKGMLSHYANTAGLKLDPRLAAQAKAIEDEINDEIKLSEGLFGAKKDASMARIANLRQQKNRLYGLTGATNGSNTPAGVRDISEFQR